MKLTAVRLCLPLPPPFPSASLTSPHPSPLFLLLLLLFLYGARRCAKKVSGEIFLICDGQEQTRQDICASALDTLYYKNSKVLFVTRAECVLCTECVLSVIGRARSFLSQE
jgi:hypothetical protein